MSSASIRDDITTTLAAFETGDFAASSKNLLQTLGYRSERIPPMQPNDANDFIRMFPAERPDTNTEKEFSEHIESVSVIFQVTSEEIANSASSQQNLFTTAEFDEGRAQSFVFIAAELKEAEYARGQYARFVREINKRFPMPIVALFRASSGTITLAFVNRRANKRDSNRDVLGNVSLIREIDPRNPHRAHLDILSDLSLDDRLRWMDANGKTANFDGLLAAWLDTLDTQELNKRFYNDLYGWFERAVSQAKFPKSDAKHLKPEEHVIRLITRMLFVWFVKEKGLIANDLFIETQVARLLKDYKRDTGDSYYRAVLQNLFFATLNTEIDRRGFSRRDHSTHRDPSLYRYKNEISDADSLLDLFAKTPFINGGLFDCLDTFEATGKGGYRIDHFTDNPNHRRGYSIPNRLFFGADGIIDLFNRYKFTVEENTPAEQEVALDPELLGKVFENLLAAYNPETRETARKQTGSYYTPRAIVDYMVDEALIASLSESALPDDGDREFLSERLRYLLDYADAFNDAESLFSAAEREAIMRAIAEIKILDPAVGSGAFPMSMLHKLTLALRRLDEHNELWETLQIEIASERARAAFHTSDQQERDDELLEISDTFKKYGDSDFGRKLYLIQNSIFGVDIQPVATQIAKLRFFISLAIEQQPDSNPANNYGIKPLPNLETRFVAANTLLALSQPAQLTLGQTDAVSRLQQDLDANRERHFHANTRNKKMACRDDDARLRQRLAKALRDADFDAADADKIAEWDPYDQNDSADWFDAEYMFGITDGFDVVIGNPPYVVVKDAKLRAIYKEGVYGRMNLYGLFIQRGLQLLNDNGHLLFINPRTLLTDKYFMNLRKVIKQSSEIRGVVLIADRHNTFASVLQECIILQLARKANPSENYIINARVVWTPADLDEADAQHSAQSSKALLGVDYDETFYIGASEFDYLVFERMNSVGKRLDAYGLKAETGKIQFNNYKKYALGTSNPNASRLIWAENVQRFRIRESNRRVGKEWLSSEITDVMPPNIIGAGIITQRTTASEQPRRIIATLIEPKMLESSGIYSENGTNFISLDHHGNDVPPTLLLGALNSSPMEFVFRRLNSNVHVSAGEINKLPFPPMPEDRKTLDAIDSCVRALINRGGVDCQPDDIDAVLHDELTLDELIGSLYGFSPSEVAKIQERLMPHEAVYGLSEEEVEDGALARSIVAVSDEEIFGIEGIEEILREWDEDRY